MLKCIDLVCSPADKYFWSLEKNIVTSCKYWKSDITFLIYSENANLALFYYLIRSWKTSFFTSLYFSFLCYPLSFHEITFGNVQGMLIPLIVKRHLYLFSNSVLLVRRFFLLNFTLFVSILAHFFSAKSQEISVVYGKC